MDQRAGEAGIDLEGVAELAQDSAHTAQVATLFREHNRSLVRFLMTKLRSWQEAQDVAQEAYVRMLQLDAPDKVSFLRAFLFKTASNIAFDRLKSSRRRGQISELNFFEPETCEPSTEQNELQREAVRLLSISLQELPLTYRQALWLRRVEGLSCAQVAEHLQIPERTVRHYIAEALVYCRVRFDRAAAPVAGGAR